MAIRTYLVKSNLAVDNVQHFEKQFPSNELGEGEGFKSVSTRNVSQVVYSYLELYFLPGHNGFRFMAIFQKRYHILKLNF